MSPTAPIWGAPSSACPAICGVPAPEKKQFSDFVPADFERNPVWIACHVADYDEPWHDDTDEETFRPWSGPLPADPTLTLLVSAKATLSDGTVLNGFLSPSIGEADLSTMQPHVFLEGRIVAFWWGILEVPRDIRTAFMSAIGLDDSGVFPIRFVADPALSSGTAEITVQAWGSRASSARQAPPRRKGWLGRRR